MTRLTRLGDINRAWAIGRRVVIALTVVAGIRVLLGFLGQDLWYDEAYTLQGVDSLVGERRYATFGVIRGFGPWDFDPNLTTGPAVTVPLAPVWWVSAGSLLAIRLAMLGAFVTYCLGIVALARTVTRSLAVQGVVLLPALIIAPEHLGFALGELPGATFIVWSLVLSTRGRHGWSGLLLGLAVQSKLAFAPMVAVIAAVMVLQAFRRRDWLSALRIPLMVALPTLVFEAWRFWTFGGLVGYRRSIDEARSYIAEQNLNLYGHWTDNDAHWTKIGNFIGLLPGTGWVLLVSALMLVVLVAIRSRVARRSSGSRLAGGRGSPLSVLSAGVLVGGVLVFLGWLTQSRQVGERQVVGAFLVCAPVLLIQGCRAVDFVRGRALGVPRIVATLITVIFAVHPVVSSWEFDLDPVSEHRREVVRLIEENGATTLLADGFWQYPEYQLLSRRPAIQWVAPANQIAVFERYHSTLSGADLNAMAVACDEILGRRDDVIVCRPKVPDYNALADLRVVAWGEQDARLGQTSNEQPNGFGGLWIMIEPEDPVALRALQIFIDDTQIEVGEISAEGTVITAFVPPTVYRTSGRHVIELRNAITGQVIPVGEFRL
jgi:hypothetical protein